MFAMIWAQAAGAAPVEGRAAEPLTVEVSVGAMRHAYHIGDDDPQPCIQVLGGACGDRWWLASSIPSRSPLLDPSAAGGLSVGLGRHTALVGTLAMSAIHYESSLETLSYPPPTLTVATAVPSLGVRVMAPLAGDRIIPYGSLEAGLAVAVAWSSYDEPTTARAAPRLDAGAGIHLMPQLETVRWGTYLQGGMAWCPLLTGNTVAPTVEIGLRVGPGTLR